MMAAKTDSDLPASTDRREGGDGIESERRGERDELRESEAKYRTLFDAIDEGFAIVELVRDSAGRVHDLRFSEVNPAFERHTGMLNARGKLRSEFGAKTENHWLEVMGEVCRTGESRRVEGFNSRLSRWYRAYLSRVGEGGSDRVALVFDDITERKRHDQRREFMLKLSDALRGPADAIETQRVATHVLGEHLQVDRAFYAELAPTGTEYLIADSYVSEGTSKRVGRFPVSTFTSIVQSFSRGEAPVIPDVLRSSRLTDAEKQSFLAIDVQALIGVPLIKGGRLVAQLGVHQSIPRDWNDDEVALLQETAERTWAAVERARAEAAMRESEERMRLAIHATRMVTWEWIPAEDRITTSESFADLYGLSSLSGAQAGFSLVVPEDRDAHIAKVRRIAAEGGTYVSEFRIVRGDHGRVIWLEERAEAQLGKDGGVERIIGVTLDVTDRKRADERLRDALAEVAFANEVLERRVAERTRELLEVSEMRQELLQRLVTAQEQERGRIARDLHDDTGQQIAAMLLGLNRLAKSPLGADPSMKETLAHIQSLAQDVAEKSHQLAVTLRPTILDDVGLEPAIAQYARQWSHWAGIPVEVEVLGLEVRLPPELETTIYRVAQEALTNVMRHAAAPGHVRRATRVGISLQRRSGEFITAIEDDGPGFDLDAASMADQGRNRIGIFGMQERARLAGGSVNLESSPGKGTTVYLRLPIPTPDPPISVGR